jgi:hypothetical protein
MSYSELTIARQHSRAVCKVIRGQAQEALASLAVNATVSIALPEGSQSLRTDCYRTIAGVAHYHFGTGGYSIKQTPGVVAITRRAVGT